MQYKLIEENDKDRFVREVQTHIDLCWELQGGPSIAFGKDDWNEPVWTYVQALIQSEEEDIKTIKEVK